MCGLAGFWNFSKEFKEDQLHNITELMTNQIKHRGPNDKGIWIDQMNCIAMGHRRLSIIDLSSAGKQPMISRSGRFIMVYNGEVYNALKIQTELARLGYEFTGHSDTEVILAAIEEWGIKEAVVKFIGMFAIVIWDHKLNNLTLIKDRLGVKPLYYALIDNNFFFGSQLKSFFVHPNFAKIIDLETLAKYVKLNYIPTPYSIFKNCYKLEPAIILTIDSNQKIYKFKYWSLDKIISSPKKSIIKEQDVINELHELLKDSINLRMISSDVPVGAFLSGGIDSSLVVALMQARSVLPIKTFTIGFNQKNYNEAEYAKSVARYLGCSHTDLILEPRQALEIIPNLADVYDEPFGDSSQIPTLLVSKLAKEQVTVSLSGDGGDELFAGYNRYYAWHHIISKITLIPKKSRNFLADLIYNIIFILKHKLNIDLDFNINISNFIRINSIESKLLKLANTLSFDNNQDFYDKTISYWRDQNPLLNILSNKYIDQNNLFNRDLVYLRDQDLASKLDLFVERMQLLDLNNYLLDDILTKVDRASMAYGLEAREPLLDHRIVEFAWQLPLNIKIRAGEQKWILKQILAKYLPKNLINRPKMGFAIPIGEWLKKELRDWAFDLLNPLKLDQQGIFNSKIINEKLNKHLTNKKDEQYDLWGILMFQSWYDKYLS